MKKLALIICLLVTQVALSQGFLSEDKLWHVRNTAWGTIYTEIFKIEGDTVINSLTYKKLWSTSDSTLEVFSNHAYLREVENVVYYRSDFTSGEGVIYDFNLEAGDTTYVTNAFCQNIQAIVTAVDTVEYFGVPRKTWTLESDWIGDTWVDGIGGLSGLIYSFECITDNMFELICFHKNDTLYFMKEGEVECFQTNVGLDEPDENLKAIISPNPVLSGQQFGIQCDGVIEKVEIRNLAGLIITDFDQINQNEYKISTTAIHPGFYIIMC
jgi:hypothetical protein